MAPTRLLNSPASAPSGSRPCYDGLSHVSSWLFSDPLPVGRRQAPDFTLPDQLGHAVKLAACAAATWFLVFYPGDDTPGCTKQLWHGLYDQ